MALRMTFSEWEAEQYNRALSYIDPELDEPLRPILNALLVSDVREITPDDLYARLRINPELLDHALRIRIGDAMRRADWQKKYRNRGPHSSWVWVPLERRPTDESDDFINLTQELAEANTDLSRILIAPNTSLTDVLTVADYSSYVAISALLTLVTKPRLRTRAPGVVAQAARTLLSSDARGGMSLLQNKLEEIRRLQAAARSPRRNQQLASPTPRSAEPAARAAELDLSGVDFEVDEPGAAEE